MLSPFLFAIYLNEFIELLHSEGCRGIQISDHSQNISVLLYGDYMALCADSTGDLQKQLNVLQKYCEDFGMSVNMKKIKNSCFLKWWYNSRL